MQRARVIIENCAHPAHQNYLHRYIERGIVGRFRHVLRTAFDPYRNLLKHGAMLPDLDLVEIS